jgi:coniferyl-aldehyde dehydrogenase
MQTDTTITDTTDVDRIFNTQKEHYSPADAPTLKQRTDRLERIERLLQENYVELIDALVADFGTRSRDQILSADIFPPMNHLAHVKRRLRQWIKPQRRSSGPLGLLGVRSRVINEPLGVVGIMSPFNAPISLALDPAIEAIAAGNSVMIKPSELTPTTTDLFGRLVSRYFEETELAVVSGGPDVSAHFAALPWDKFLFTGGTQTGKKILAAAAPNLTPVILELGGKCPAVVLPDADIERVGAKIAQGRLGNGGQVCLDVDYALVPDALLEPFISAVIAKNNADFPTVQHNPDVSSIIDDRSYERILAYIHQARENGYRVIQPDLYRDEILDPGTRQLPLTIIVDPGDDLSIHREEVFGPILSIYTYHQVDDAIAIINAKDKPLALYIFGKSKRDICTITTHTTSGGITVNDLALHALSTSIGFGGVGPSGMGRYQGGRIGYEAFTNPKAVVTQSRLLGRYSGSLVPPLRSERQRNTILRLAHLPRP